MENFYQEMNEFQKDVIAIQANMINKLMTEIKLRDEKISELSDQVVPAAAVASTSPTPFSPAPSSRPAQPADPVEASAFPSINSPGTLNRIIYWAQRDPYLLEISVLRKGSNNIIFINVEEPRDFIKVSGKRSEFACCFTFEDFICKDWYVVSLKRVREPFPGDVDHE